MAEAELAQKGVQNGPFGTDNSFTVPSLNVFIQHAKLKARQSYSIESMAIALTFTYLLASKTESTAESYVTKLASDMGLPNFTLVCTLLREPVQSLGLDLGRLAKTLATFKSTIQIEH